MPSPPLTSDLSHSLAEGARYALLRRLAPCLRHEAVAPVQPLAMAASVLERRLCDPVPNFALVQETAARLTSFSRAAVQSCLNLLDWLAPAQERTVSLQETVRDTLALLRGSLQFRGFTLSDQLHNANDPVGADRLRYVLPACLLWLTDSVGAPAEVTLCAQDAGGQLRLVIDLQPSAGEPGVQEPPAYRPLRDEDVQALAYADGIALERHGDTLWLTLARAS
jgi:hypothetical protein